MSRFINFLISNQLSLSHFQFSNRVADHATKKTGIVNTSGASLAPKDADLSDPAVISAFTTAMSNCDSMQLSFNDRNMAEDCASALSSDTGLDIEAVRRTGRDSGKSFYTVRYDRNPVPVVTAELAEAIGATLASFFPKKKVIA